MAASQENQRASIDVSDAWNRFRDRLRAFALRRVGSSADADDVVQDVLVRLMEHRDRIESGRVAAWLFTTARNAIIDRRRRSGREGLVAADADALRADEGEKAEPVAEMAACVQPLLAMLSVEDRDVLEMVELAGESQAELAACLNVAPSTVKSRVQRARQRLRDHFERCCTIELDFRGVPHDFASRGNPDYPRCDGCEPPQTVQVTINEKDRKQ